MALALAALLILTAFARTQFYLWKYSTKHLGGHSAEQVIAELGDPFSDSREKPTNHGIKPPAFELDYYDASGDPWEIYFDSTRKVREVRPGPWKAQR